MRCRGKGIRLALLAALCLSLAGCAGKVEESPGTAQSQGAASGERGGVVVEAGFYWTDGTALSGGSASLSDGQEETAYQMDEEGRFTARGLPREGAVRLVVFDREERELGSMTVRLTVGEVIDASTDEEGTGYVTLRTDTEQVSLTFTVQGDGTLQCALRLDD